MFADLKIKFYALLLITLLFCLSACVANKTIVKDKQDIDFLSQHFTELASAENKPIVYLGKTRKSGVSEIYLQGEPYAGKPTRIFALYKASNNPIKLPSGKSPAVVLVHGGGGSAFEEWVIKWNDAGFAAISVAVEGQTDQRITAAEKTPAQMHSPWVKHAYAGPARAGIYGDDNKEISEQWMFHASSAVIRAKNYLASIESIDSAHIGLSGISWGGVITSTVMGFDPSFDFAIPVYGIGFLDTIQNQYAEKLTNNKSYAKYWEPGLRINRFKAPSLWLTWMRDKHFSLDAQAKTYNLSMGDVAVSIKPNMKHGHKAGWMSPESYLFAQQAVLTGKPWAHPTSTVSEKAKLAKAQFLIDLPNNEFSVDKATLYYTSDSGHTSNAKWIEKTASLTRTTSAKGNVEVSYFGLPNNVRHWFYNLEVTVNPGTPISQTYIVSSKVVSPNSN